MHISLALWPSKSLQGKTSNVLLKTRYFIWCGNFLCRNILLETILNQNCFLTIWHWSYKTTLERNCPIMREKQLHWSDQFDHINEIFVPNFLLVRFIASFRSKQGRKGHAKFSQRLNLMRPNHANSFPGFRKLCSLLLARIGRDHPSRPIRDIETFSSK